MAGVCFSFFFAFCQTCSVSLTNVDSSQIRLVPNKWRICSGHSFIVASEQDSAKLHNMRLIGGTAALVSYCFHLAKFPEEAFLICRTERWGVWGKARKSTKIKQLVAAFEEISAETVWSELDYRLSVKSNDQTEWSLFSAHDTSVSFWTAM